MSAKSILESGNDGSESKNDCETVMWEQDEGDKDPSSHLGM